MIFPRLRESVIQRSVSWFRGYSLSPSLPEDESVLDLLEAHLELLPVEARVAVREHLVRHQLKVVRPEM